MIQNNQSMKLPHFFIFILPSFVLYFLFFMIPLFQGIYFSFTDWNGIRPEIKLQFDKEEFEDRVLKGLSGDDRKLILTYYQKSNSSYIFKSFREIDKSSGTYYSEITSREKKRIKKILEGKNYRMIQWIGFANYKEILTQDQRYAKVIRFSIFFTLLNVVLTNLTAFLLALAVDREFRGKNLVRSVFFIPNVISLIIVAFIWSFVFQFISRIPVLNIGWLGSPETAPWAVIIVSVWQGCGYLMMIYLAGLQSIPQDILEVAQIDGVSGLKKLVHIMIPMMIPSFTISIFLSITNSLRSFDIIFALTGGGPGYVTTPFVLDIFINAFSHNRFGYGTAKSVILGIIIVTITTAQLILMKRKEIES